MSTPASIILRNAYDDGSEADIAHIYRHHDGYPSHAAPCACGDDRAFPSITNRNWVQHVVKALCADGSDLEFVDKGRMPESAYTYVIAGSHSDLDMPSRLAPNGFLCRTDIECRCGRSTLFCGSIEEFLQWCKGYRF